MEWLNYHHLLYFWTTAREGSITRACRELRLSQPTVSAQIRQLEDSLGEKLFARAGRGLVLTETGQLVYRYADEIFGLGRELLDAVRGRPTGRPLRLVVGIADAVPKLVAYRLLQPAFEIPEPVRISCREDRPERLLASLALHELDLVISDAPVGPEVRVRAFSHPLGECGISFFAHPDLARTLRRGFPTSLGGAPMLLPGEPSSLRRGLDQWFESIDTRPRIVGEFDDSALLKTFGQAGLGAFAAPSAIEREVCQQFGVRVIGKTDAVRERFFAISVERRLKHPAVVRITEAARSTLGG